MITTQQQPVFSTESSLLQQTGMVVWLMGLSGAGKSTIAGLLKQKLEVDGIFSVLLDGDTLRGGINKNLGFSDSDRMENVRRAAEIANMLAENNVVAICSLITPLHEHQQVVRETIRMPYFEVFVDCPITVCERRDVKGLYKKARQNEIKHFTGISAPFKTPLHADLRLYTADQEPAQSTQFLYEQIIRAIKPY
ncbi:adenylyl-sulfate kinase [Mucilaginibacter aquariorum]|uniref:Adenylyl-sulfate kinase n=1 Tax=Mucilaginibacter aquariorum TaxID=2967225 RepID=A0ABT1SVM0_9SPHI|nr:adenylyl-sulfate kinase [Mucilaginibacter aquariorum]MCQ6956387.1 adenylyl-sulfate kinase [Mucilaginibacter aquariorum]